MNSFDNVSHEEQLSYQPTLEDWSEYCEYLDSHNDGHLEDWSEYCEYLDSHNDGQPDEYTEWQDYMGGDDWDHGQYDE